jgi:hypothetical protein
VSILILSFLLGAVLGTRFRVLVLFPVIGAVVLIAVLAGLVGGTAISAVVIDAGLAVSGVQVGYFAGILVSSLSPGQAAHWSKSHDQRSWPTA